jgi:hypothetical protein
VKSVQQAYPLSWPVGWKVTPSFNRKRAQFNRSERQYHGEGQGNSLLRRDLSIADGTARVLAELGRMGIPDYQVIISTNAPLRRDGLPRSDVNPQEPGAAVYFRDGDHERVIAVDRYDRLADNLGAIAATLEAMRAIKRHGGAKILERAFTGFAALPAPGETAARSWREVLGIAPDAAVTKEAVEQRYKLLRSANHPDRGGSGEAFHAVQAAYEQALQVVR